MHIIFTAMLIAQLHNGHDLLRECTVAPTTATCDALIKEDVASNPGSGCVPIDNPKSLKSVRDYVVKFLKEQDDLGKPATDLLNQAFASSDSCGAADGPLGAIDQSH